MNVCAEPRPSSATRACRRAHARAHAAARGFTLLESLIAVAVAGVLSSIAYTSVEAQLQRARRTDALVALMQVQLAEERHRANSTSYASLAELGMRETSPGGHYRLQATVNDSGGYDLLATAVATQARDATCRYLRLALLDGALVQSSGSDATTSNDAFRNRACWSR